MQNSEAQTAPTINWLTAPPVPVKVFQMRAAGKTPEGTIHTGPGGQQTYVGPIRALETDSNDWRSGLKEVPDS